MKKLLLVIWCACAVNAGGAGEPSCVGNTCDCPSGSQCTHACSAGSTCEVQGGAAARVDVTCTATDTCEVQCAGAASCRVDCAGRADCQVTCPTTSCTVENIPPSDPNVTCANAGLPTRAGTTATCP